MSSLKRENSCNVEKEGRKRNLSTALLNLNLNQWQMQPLTLLAKTRGRRAGGKTSITTTKRVCRHRQKCVFFLTISEGKSGDV